MNTVCVILAGGRSRRMGLDKAELPMGNGTFLSRLIDEYAPAFPVYVSVRVPGQFPHPGAGELVDRRPGMGPLAGLETAFLMTAADAVFLTATDLPFGSLTLARCLLERAGDADACVIRRRDGNPEPAFGIYTRACLEPLTELLDRDRRSVRGLLERVNTRYVPEETLADFPLERLLLNVNTPEIYRQALELML